eukprot:scaffold3498_cov17-Tisochrysis_lutea.AAC.2
MSDELQHYGGQGFRAHKAGKQKCACTHNWGQLQHESQIAALRHRRKATQGNSRRQFCAPKCIVKASLSGLVTEPSSTEARALEKNNTTYRKDCVHVNLEANIGLLK